MHPNFLKKLHINNIHQNYNQDQPTNNCHVCNVIDALTIITSLYNAPKLAQKSIFIEITIGINLPITCLPNLINIINIINLLTKSKSQSASNQPTNNCHVCSFSQCKEGWSHCHFTQVGAWVKFV